MVTTRKGYKLGIKVKNQSSRPFLAPVKQVEGKKRKMLQMHSTSAKEIMFGFIRDLLELSIAIVCEL